MLAVVSSSAWWFPFTRNEAYGASKAALTYFAESLRADLDADDDLAETPNWLLKQALARYTHSPAYLEAIIAGRRRLALDGSDAGAVTETAIEHAQARRQEQKQRAAERRRQRSSRNPSAEQARERKLQRLAAKFNKQIN